MIPREIRLTVIGLPGPQGSKSFKGMRDGHAVLVESSKKVKPWRMAVMQKAKELLMRSGGPPLEGPLSVEMFFTLPRPKSAPKRVLFPIKYPDVSKLVRSTEDALTQAGIWGDDAQVVDLWACKRFPAQYPINPQLGEPGCVIIVRELAGS